MPQPLTDQAVADAFLRRLLTLTWVAGLVGFSAMAVVALLANVLPASSRNWVTASAVAGLLAVAGVLIVAVRQTVRLAVFAFRKELR
jgi:hypothetical protein